jgi:acyl-CoA thioesterase
VKDPQALAEAVAQRLFAMDEASRALGIEILEVGPGFARLTMTVTQAMLNGHAICHGGYVFLLADSAFAFACNSHDRVTVAAGGNVEFLAAAKVGEALTATARELSRTRRLGVYDIEVSGENGRRIALLRGRAYERGGAILS